MRVYSAANPTEAHLLVALLKEKGIVATVQGEYAFQLRGEVPCTVSPEVWVAGEEDAAKARHFIENEFSSRKQINGEKWTCPKCNSENEPQFEVCWKCAGETRRTSAPDLSQVPAKTQTESAAPQELGAIWYFEIATVLLVYWLPTFLSSINAFGSQFPTQYLQWIVLNCSYLVGNIALIALLFLHHPGEAAAAGCFPRGWRAETGLGLLVLIVHYFALQMFWNTVYRMDPALFDWLTRSVPDTMPLPGTNTEMALAALMNFMVGVSEELIFRGFLLNRFEKITRSGIWAILISTLFFALPHAYQGNVGLVSAMVAGLVYGTFYCWTKRLWPVILAHGTLNLLLIAGVL